jgi:hypothetical protein
MDRLAAGLALVEGNLTIKPATFPPTGPLVLHGRRQFHSAFVLVAMKSNAPKLDAEGFVVLILFNFLLLVVQFIIFGKDQSSWSTYKCGNSLEEF